MLFVMWTISRLRKLMDGKPKEEVSIRYNKSGYTKN